MTHLRTELEKVAANLLHCEWIGCELVDDDLRVMPELEQCTTTLVAGRELALEWLRNHPRPPVPSTNRYWPAFCTSCGWAGLSRDCAGGEPLADTGDFDDIRCPVCQTAVEEDERE